MWTKKQAHEMRQWQKALTDYRKIDQQLTQAIEAGIGESQITGLRQQWEEAKACWQMWEERVEQHP